jgi:hypothetical protein
MRRSQQTMNSPFLGKDTASRKKVRRTGGEVIFADALVVLEVPEPISTKKAGCRGLSKRELSAGAQLNLPPQAWFDAPEADLTKPV